MGIRELCRRTAYLFRRNRFTGELEEEMRLHLEMRARKMADPSAARRKFGNTASLQEASSQAWGWPALEQLAQDARYALRALRRTPIFTVVAISTLALGLGMNTAVFSIVHAVMLRDLPYPDPGRLVSLWESFTRNGPDQFRSSGSAAGGMFQRTSVSVANLMDYRQGTRSFTGLAGVGGSPMNLTGSGNPERIWGDRVTANFFAVLGVPPLRGRWFTPEEDRPGGDAAVMIGYDFWQRRLGGADDVLERSVMLDSRPYRIIGVLPRGFQPPNQFGRVEKIEFFVPAAYPAEQAASHGDHDIEVVGRLLGGASLAAAQAELDAVSARLQKQFPESNQGVRAVIGPLRDDIVRGARDSSIALLGASALIVLIACVNVANLLLVRAVARRRETSVRFALGASRARVVRQALLESMAVAAAGCVCGLVLGAALMRLLVSMAPANIPRLDTAAMNWTVFAVSTAIAILTGIAFAVAPAWQVSRAQASEALRTASRSTGGAQQMRWRSVLTAAEVAISTALLIGAGLMLKSFVLLAGVDLGFQPERVIAMNVNLPETRYPTADQRLRFFQQLEERVAALPGVESVAFANRMPMRGGWGSGFRLDAMPDTQLDSDFQAVSPGYFTTLGIPLMRGRLLRREDRTGEPMTAVVNQAFARDFLHNADPIGQRFQWNSQHVAIVGMVRDIRRGGKAAKLLPEVYLPAAQADTYPVRLADFAIRSGVDPRRLVKAIEAQVWALDKDQPVSNVRTLEEIVPRTGIFRGAGGSPCRDWRLRCLVLCGLSAHVRVGHPHRTRSATAPDPRHGAAAGRWTGLRGRPVRIGCRLRLEPLPGDLAVRSTTARLDHVRGRRGRAGGRRVCGRADPRPPWRAG
jgi:putative ABC transport system permease protein